MGDGNTLWLWGVVPLLGRCVMNRKIRSVLGKRRDPFEGWS